MKFRDAQANGLTQQQLEIVGYLADGKRHSDIIELMGLSKTNISTQIHRACNVTGANTSSGLVAFALRRGLIR